jgi:hypothetical protein
MIIAKAIKKINPNAEFKYLEEDINTIEWLNVKPCRVALLLSIQHAAAKWNLLREKAYL